MPLIGSSIDEERGTAGPGPAGCAAVPGPALADPALADPALADPALHDLAGPGGLAFESLLEASPNPYILLAADFTIVWMNAAYLEATGRSRAELVGRDMFEAFPSDPRSDSRRQLRESLERAVRERVRDHIPLIRYDIPDPAGGPPLQRYWSATHTPLPDAEGRVRLVLQHTVDVTGLHRQRLAGGGAEDGSAQASTRTIQVGGAVFRRAQDMEESSRALARERDRLRSLFEQAPGFMALLEGPDHVFVLANAACTALVGRRDLIGRPLREALPDIASQDFPRLLDEVYASGRTYVGRGARLLLRPAPGVPAEERILDFVYQPILDAEGRVGGIFVQGQDLTEQRRAQAALKESEQRFRLVAEGAPVMLWMTDAAGRAIYLNKAQRAFWGRPAQEPAGQGPSFDWRDNVHPADRLAMIEPVRRAVRERTGFDTQGRVRRADGEYRYLQVRAEPRFESDGRFAGFTGVNADITEQRRAEEALQALNATLEQQVADRTAQLHRNEAALRQAQKMEAVGKLTGGVAHDFNNLLQVIGGSLQLLSRELAGNPRAEQRLQHALAGVARGSRLAAQLLAFGRRQPLAPKPVDLARLLSRLQDMLRQALGGAIELQIDCAPDLWNSFVDPAQLENALLNLAINARDAIDGTGRVAIAAENAILSAREASRHDLVPGDYVMLSLSDTGRGMTPEVAAQAVEPFFTTKAEGRGTGLGLSQVYGFARQSGGHIRIASTPGIGTTVALFLPRTGAPAVADDGEEEDRPAPVAARQAAPAARGAGETVLVVEDDPEVRRTVADMVAELGYRVLQAEDADSALALLQRGGAVDLLFTDVIMPGRLRSSELARSARRLLPQVAVLFTSGFTEGAIEHGGRLDAGVDLLSKPYTREALALRLRRALDRRRTAPPAAPPRPAPRSTPPPRPGLPPRPVQAQFQAQPAAKEAAAKEAAAKEAAAKEAAAKVAAAKQSAQQAKETVVAKEKAGVRRILLVEDEALIRLTVADMLVDLGHEVVEAGSGGEALAALERGPVDLMLADLGLPDMNGGELAAIAARRQPGLPIVFATGRSAKPDLPPDAPVGRTVLLPKPYDERSLAAAVSEALG